MSNVAVVIPVGPSAGRHQRWWHDAVLTARAEDPAAIILIDDMAALPDEVEGCEIWRAPWRVGVAAAFNIGVALALEHAPLALMLGADDLLRGGALAAIEDSWCQSDRQDGYYWMWVEYFGGRLAGDVQRLVCNAAAVTAGCWRETGGFPLESVVDAPDSMLVSILLRHRPGMLRQVMGGPYYMVRQHGGQETWQPKVGGRFARDFVTERWRGVPDWTALPHWMERVHKPSLLC